MLYRYVISSPQDNFPKGAFTAVGRNKEPEMSSTTQKRNDQF